MRDLAKYSRAIAEFLSAGVALAFITDLCFQLRLNLATPALLYLIVIVLLSLRGSFLSSAIFSFIAVGLLAYYFVPPVFSFSVADSFDLVTIIAFLTASGVITRLVSRLRELMQEKLRQNEVYLAEAQRLSHTGSFCWKTSTGEMLWSEEIFRIFQYDPSTKPSLGLILQRVDPEDAKLRERNDRTRSAGKKGSRTRTPNADAGWHQEAYPPCGPCRKK